MSMFEDALTSAKTVADATCKKAGEVVSIARKKMEIMDLESRLEKLYGAIGKFYVDTQKNQVDHKDECNQIISEIGCLIGKISKKKSEIDNLKNIAKCTDCNTGNEKDSVFCKKCGAKMK